MQLKWLEDFVTLAETLSFSRAAELRHVTHPAFGRRIQALEGWTGMELVERGASPVRLTAAGTLFLDTARQMVRGLEGARDELHAAAGRHARTVTIATGRTLARTVLADWLVRLHPLVRDAQVRVLTRSLADAVQLLERNEADFTLVYHHAALTVQLDGRQFAHVTLASEKLVPVCRADAQGAPVFPLQQAGTVPLLTYGPTLAMGRLQEDFLAHNTRLPPLQRCIECDSADALAEYALKGLGVAWLPWSMVQADCKAGRLALAGTKSMEIRFEVRLYRPKRRLSPLGEAVWQSAARA